MSINSHYLMRLVLLFLHFIEKLRRTRAHQRNYPNLEVNRKKLWLVTLSLIHKRKKRDLKRYVCVCVCVCVCVHTQRDERQQEVKEGAITKRGIKNLTSPKHF